MDTKTKIKGLFGQKIQITVPSYQRAYSWTVGDDKVGQVDQFLDDIREHDVNKTYYLGHFLFEKDPVFDYKYYVIDGQQRLTTTVIFMSCLIRELQQRNITSIDEESVEEIAETYLIHHNRHKFETVVADAVFFEQRIIQLNPEAARDSDRKSLKLLDEAEHFFSKKMRGFSFDELCKMYRILSNAMITTFVMEGEDAKLLATQIFAFQNDRGKALTQLEKLKAYCMHQMYRYAEPEQVLSKISVLENDFSQIYSNVESLKTTEDQVLNWHCQAFTSGWSDAFSCIKNDFAKAEDKKQWILNFVHELSYTYKLMQKFESLEQGYECRLVADICYLDKPFAAPLILKLLHYDKWRDNDFEVLRAVEKILFKLRFTIGDFRTNRLIYFAKKYDGTEASLLPDLHYAVNNGFQGTWDFNGACRQYFASNSYHYRGDIKYVLYKYENYLRRLKKEPELSPDECSNIFETRSKSLENTLDHITPQDPDFTTYTDDFRTNFLNDIGNLTLMTWSNNSSKSNHNPADPSIRDRYDSVFRAQKEIFHTLCQDGQWGEDQIRARKKKIIDFVIAQWGL